MNDNSAVRALPPEGGAKRQKKPRKRGIEGVVAQTVLIVFLLILLFLTLLPVLITLIMSFKDANDITSNSVWSFPQNGWHFSNYASAFTDTYSYMINTIIITFISVVVTMLLSCYIAFLFVRKHFAGKNVLFFLIIIPMLVPAVVTLSPTYITVLGSPAIRSHPSSSCAPSLDSIPPTSTRRGRLTARACSDSFSTSACPLRCPS